MGSTSLFQVMRERREARRKAARDTNDDSVVTESVEVTVEETFPKAELGTPDTIPIIEERPPIQLGAVAVFPRRQREQSVRFADNTGKPVLLITVEEGGRASQIVLHILDGSKVRVISPPAPQASSAPVEGG